MAETFKCPSCSAPLEYEGKTMQKCKHCGSSVIAPTGVMRGSNFFGQAGSLDFGDLSSLTGKALKIAEIQGLIQHGKKIEAIKVFRDTFGSGLAEAKNAVDAMERGESVDISGMTVRSGNAPMRIAVDGEAVKKAAIGIGGSFLAMFLVIALIIIGVIAFVFYTVSRTVDRALDKVPNVSTPAKSPVVSPKIDQRETPAEIVRFGGEGIGAGKFKDNRTIAVAADGRVFSADYQGGRIQVFDAAGVFQLQITADPNRTIDKLAIDRRGVLFVRQGYDILRFESSTGEALGTTRIDFASDLALALDGKAYVPTRRGEIQVMNSDGTKLRTIKVGADLNITAIELLTVDGTGNLIVMDERTFAIYKLTPDGKILTRFGGRASPGSANVPRNGMFAGRPTGMAVDSQGRIYVAETDRISIFESDGLYLKDFVTKQTFDIAITDKDQVFVASRPFVVGYTPLF